MAEFKVVVDDHKCVGAGQCVITAPAIFDQSDDGIVVLLDARPSPEQHAAARKAAALCPARVIRIDENPE